MDRLVFLETLIFMNVGYVVFCMSYCKTEHGGGLDFSQCILSLSYCPCFIFQKVSEQL